MSDLTTAAIDLNELSSKLRSVPEKNQIELIAQLANCGDPGIDILIEFLRDRLEKQPPNLADSKTYQTLLAANSLNAKEFLLNHCPRGILPLRSERGIDYYPLQQLLAQQEFLLADRMTLQKLCELAGSATVQRKWIYFTEVESFPSLDLQTIDALWWLHSEGKFGFSVQRSLWLATGKKWEKLWDKIGWKTGNRWTRYPQEFIWNLTAPPGHLPLSNQLRGVRVISALLSHPAWEEDKSPISH